METPTNHRVNSEALMALGYTPGRAFGRNSFVGNLKDKAWAQLGTSGGGNHFVEFGIIEFTHADDTLGIPAGRYLAYLGLDTEAGQEYWQAMTLAGDYASANHEVVHRKLVAALGAEVLATVGNHHTGYLHAAPGADGR